MSHSNTIFHQLLKFLPHSCFQKTVDRYNGDYRRRKLSCWDQLLAMLFCQLCGRQSLRDIVEGFNSQHRHLYHLGSRKVHRSTLADANNKTPTGIFKEAFYYLLGQVRTGLPSKTSKEMIRLIDSTTIDLNLNQFEWAKFRSSKSGIKLHTVYDPESELPVYFEMTSAKTSDSKAVKNLPILPKATYVVDRAYNTYSWFYSLTQQKSFFVGRMKCNARYEVKETRETDSPQVISDEVISFCAPKAQKDCPIPLRRIVFLREEDKKTLVFISNDFGRSAQEIADLYKQRWQIELFFKWIKQNLKIKRFVGRSENAVMIQVLVALISYVLLRLAQTSYPSSFSLQQIARLMAVNLMNRKTMEELLKPDRGKENDDEKTCPQMEIKLGYF